MACSNFKDCNNEFIYENDILKYQNKLAIVKKGQYKYDNMLLYGWYLEIYQQGIKNIEPFNLKEVDNYEIIGNIYKNYNLYEKIKKGNWSEIQYVS